MLHSMSVFLDRPVPKPAQSLLFKPSQIMWLWLVFLVNQWLYPGAVLSCQVWDIRKFKSPVHVVDGLPTLFSTTQCIFSPDERLIVTGTSADRSGNGGCLTFIDRDSFEVVRRVAMPTSVVALQWHDRLNQIFVGTGE